MGSGSWDSSKWQNFATQQVSNKGRAQVFASTALKEAYDPKKFTNGIRESVDSPDNPLSTPVAIFTDCTGSMGSLAHEVIKKLDVVCEELIERKPVTDVHLLTGVVGDGYSDRAPLQATQFEADIRIAEQTKELYLEGNGGGNGGESYALPWVFAGMQTATDCYDKRKKKGYLFTVGDEPIHGVEGVGGEDYHKGGQGQKWGVTKEQAERILGVNLERDLTADECLAMAETRWHVFHIIVGQRNGDYGEGIERTWGKLMPNNLVRLDDISALPETVVSIIEVNEGKDAKKVAASWSGSTAVAVANALQSLAARDAGGVEVVRL